MRDLVMNISDHFMVYDAEECGVESNIGEQAKCFICGKKREMFRTEKVVTVVSVVQHLTRIEYFEKVASFQVPICKRCNRKVGSWIGGFAEKAKIKTFPPLRDAMTQSEQMKTKWVGGPDAGVWLLVGVFLVLAIVVGIWRSCF